MSWTENCIALHRHGFSVIRMNAFENSHFRFHLVGIRFSTTFQFAISISCISRLSCNSRHPFILRFFYSMPLNKPIYPFPKTSNTERIKSFTPLNMVKGPPDHPLKEVQLVQEVKFYANICEKEIFLFPRLNPTVLFLIRWTCSANFTVMKVHVLKILIWSSTPSSQPFLIRTRWEQTTTYRKSSAM